MLTSFAASTSAQLTGHWRSRRPAHRRRGPQSGWRGQGTCGLLGAVARSREHGQELVASSFRRGLQHVTRSGATVSSRRFIRRLEPTVGDELGGCYPDDGRVDGYTTGTHDGRKRPSNANIRECWNPFIGTAFSHDHPPSTMG